MFWVKLMDAQAKSQSKPCSPFITVRKFPLMFLAEKGKLAPDFFAVGSHDHPPPHLYYCYWYAISCCCCSPTNVYAGAMNIVQYYSKRILPMLIATNCCNGVLVLQETVALNCCNTLLCCNELMQQNIAIALFVAMFALQHILL